MPAVARNNEAEPPSPPFSSFFALSFSLLLELPTAAPAGKSATNASGAKTKGYITFDVLLPQSRRVFSWCKGLPAPDVLCLAFHYQPGQYHVPSLQFLRRNNPIPTVDAIDTTVEARFSSPETRQYSQPMGDPYGRAALRGAEVQVLDFIFETSTSEQWAELLKGPLEGAVCHDNRGLVQKLVRAGARIGDALHMAAGSGHEEVVTDLLENGASINAQDGTNHQTPLHIAVELGKPEMVQLLMLKGADKDAKDGNGWTPLHTAALANQATSAQALLAGGADVSIRCDTRNMSVVHLAAQKGHVDILRAVIEHGADVEATDDDQATALHYCAEAEAIDFLVEAGANIEAKDGEGCTPLHCAAAYLSIEALTALLEHDANINAQDNVLGNSLYRAAANAGEQGAADVVDFLLRSGADETVVCSNGKTVADFVDFLGNHDVVEQDGLAEDIERMRMLLANAPADRAWRRRGYLVLCRAHPDRVQQTLENSSIPPGTSWMTRSQTKLARTEALDCSETVGGSAVDGPVGGEWAIAVSRVLALQEEGIFRTIVGYL